MCVVSNMGDIGGGMWPKPKPAPAPSLPWVSPVDVKPFFPYNPGPMKPWVPAPGQTIAAPLSTFPSREQFEAFDALLRAAKKFDDATGQKECETAAKTAWIKSFYDHFGMSCPL